MHYETNEIDFIEAVKYQFPEFSDIPTQDELREFSKSIAADFDMDEDRAVRVAECNRVFAMKF